MSQDSDNKPRTPDDVERIALEGHPEDQVVTFGELIARIDDGEFSVTLGDELAAGFAKLRDLAGEEGSATGKLSLQFSFEVNPKGEVTILVKKDLRVPTKSTGVTTMWLTPRGRLSATNPQQMKLFGGRRTTKREPRRGEE